MINVTLKSQLASTTAKINDIAYCIENKTFYRLSSTDESITIDNTDFIVSNGTNYWIAFGGQNSKLPQKVLNETLDEKVDVSTTSIIEKEPTGFRYPDDVIVTYNSTSRTVTLTGNTECYLNGKRISTLYIKNIDNSYSVFSTSFESGWVSPVHDDITATIFFCYISWENEKAVVSFNTTAWDFSSIQICFVQHKISADGGTKSIGLHETHGLNMNHMTHSHLHKSIGTFRETGGGIGGVTLTSYTVEHRRPTIEQTTLIDEDVKTILPIHTKNNYTLRYLSGNSQLNPTKNFITGANDIVQLSGNIPLINTWNGSAWVSTTQMTNNQYACLFLVAVPTSSDTESQKFRYMWIQPQTANSTLSTIQAITPNNLVHGDTSFLLTEYCFIGKVIIKYVGGGTSNWHIYSTELITGNRSSQVSISGGSGYLTTVPIDINHFQLNSVTSVLELKDFDDNIQYANKNGTWTEIVGGSSEVAPVITTSNLTLNATTHYHVINNNTTDLIHILPLVSTNNGKRFLLKNKNTGLVYLKSGQVSVTGSANINGIYSENGVVNGRMSYVCNYGSTMWQLIKYSGTAWQIFSNTDNTTAVITATNGNEIYPYNATWVDITVTQVTDTIDGLTTIVLPVKGSYIEVESDGVTWNVIRESY